MINPQSAIRTSPVESLWAERQSRGFTLVELLVVIAIISLLASILLPSLQRANESAKRVMCMSNLASIGVAQEMYSVDFPDWLPAVQVTPEGYIENISWDTALQDFAGCPFPPYTSNYWTWPTAGVDPQRDIFSCPSDASIPPFGRKRSYGRYIPNGLEDVSHTGWWWEVWAHPRRRNDFPNYAQTILVAEWHAFFNIRRMNWLGGSVSRRAYFDTGWTHPFGDSWSGMAAPVTAGIPVNVNHGGEGSNFLLMDAHVEWWTPAEADQSIHWPERIPF